MSLSDEKKSEITKETIALLRRHEGHGIDRLDVIALVMGGLFAYMGQKVNAKDCVAIVERAMKMIGWKK